MDFHDLDEIRYEEDDLDAMPVVPRYIRHEPIIVRGAGNVTL